MYNADRIAAILMFVVVLIFAFQFSDIPSSYSRIFPKAVAWALVVLSAILLIRSWVNPRVVEFAETRELKKVGLAILLLFGWMVCISFLGFYLSSVLFFTLLMILVEPSILKPNTLTTSIFIAAVEIGLFYLVFTRALNVPLPKGMIFQ
ncbi:MAG TPA: tripartite tricarboxylate transporter TctB family protein [Corynebacteriales bacterium]|nr:tripartite tricarboxylate transporter TctB family protein [Mycobacteriales bacterium]